MFLLIQFISTNTSIEFNSRERRSLCENIGIPEEEAETFWMLKGNKAVEETIRMKRASTVAAMKKKFLSQMKLCQDHEGNDEFVSPPDPREFLPKEIIDIVNRGEDMDPFDFEGIPPEAFVNTIVEKRLRSNNDSTSRINFANFLYLFAKTVLGKRLFEKIVTARSSLDDYLTPALEAFIVTAYVGNYDMWKQKHDLENNNSGNLTSPQVSGKAHPLFTENSRGSGKYNGWSPEGIYIYNCITLILRRQRANLTMSAEYGKLFYQIYTENQSPTKKRQDCCYTALNDLDYMGKVFQL